MTDISSVVRQAESAGIAFRLDGEQVKIRFHASQREGLATIISTLRKHKHEVAEILRCRSDSCSVRVEVTGQSFAYMAECRKHRNPSLITVLVNGCEHIVHKSLVETGFAAREHQAICEGRGLEQCAGSTADISR